MTIIGDFLVDSRIRRGIVYQTTYVLFSLTFEINTNFEHVGPNKVHGRITIHANSMSLVPRES